MTTLTHTQTHRLNATHGSSGIFSLGRRTNSLVLRLQAATDFSSSINLRLLFERPPSVFFVWVHVQRQKINPERCGAVRPIAVVEEANSTNASGRFGPPEYAASGLNGAIILWSGGTEETPTLTTHKLLRYLSLTCVPLPLARVLKSSLLFLFPLEASGGEGSFWGDFEIWSQSVAATLHKIDIDDICSATNLKPPPGNPSEICVSNRLLGKKLHFRRIAKKARKAKIGLH